MQTDVRVKREDDRKLMGTYRKKYHLIHGGIKAERNIFNTDPHIHCLIYCLDNSLLRIENVYFNLSALYDIFYIIHYIYYIIYCLHNQCTLKK